MKNRRSSSTYQPLDWYEDEPLYYDIIFDDADTLVEADFITEVHKRYCLTRGSRVLEPGCGTGRLVAELTRRGYQVTGFDVSSSMLQFARRRLAKEKLRAQLTRARMESFSFKKKFDLAHCLIDTFRHLLDQNSALTHLHCIARSLKSGGIYVLGLCLSDYEDTSFRRRRWITSRDGIDVSCSIQFWPPNRRKRTERFRIRLIVSEKNAKSVYEAHLVFRTYTEHQLRRLLRSVPALELITMCDYEYDINRPIAYDGQRFDTVLILRRR